MDEISGVLKSEYGIVSNDVAATAGGFSAKAYRAKDTRGTDYFVKVYDKSLPTTRFHAARIDSCMPVLDWLAKTPGLSGRVLTPVATRSGAYKAETERNLYVLFLFVHGSLPKVQGMTRAQTAELAEILALLHENGDNIPFETYGIDEDTSLDFCGSLVRFLDGPNGKNGVLYGLVAPHSDMLRLAIRQALHLRDTIRLGYSPLVLCHGDAHGNNVIQGERLVLADWEDLRCAPAEADLFIYAWHGYGDTLLKAYASARGGYGIDFELLHFYVLRRRIEDVWVDIQRLTEESPGETETAKLLECIARGIAEVRAAYCR